jgi:ribosomal RNA-processing protein 17
MASMLEPGIFRHPRPKKPVLPTPNKRRKTEHKIEEINFNDDSRAEYLTGFHKRKVQRTKQAQLEAAKKAREERIVMRKQVSLSGSSDMDKLTSSLVKRGKKTGIRSSRRSCK